METKSVETEQVMNPIINTSRIQILGSLLFLRLEKDMDRRE
jgi:hypothetical protein